MPGRPLRARRCALLRRAGRLARESADAGDRAASPPAAMQATTTRPTPGSLRTWSWRRGWPSGTSARPPPRLRLLWRLRLRLLRLLMLPLLRLLMLLMLRRRRQGRRLRRDSRRGAGSAAGTCVKATGWDLVALQHGGPPSAAVALHDRAQYSRAHVGRRGRRGRAVDGKRKSAWLRHSLIESTAGAAIAAGPTRRACPARPASRPRPSTSERAGCERGSCHLLGWSGCRDRTHARRTHAGVRLRRFQRTIDRSARSILFAPFVTSA